MNTNMAGFRWFPIFFLPSCALEERYFIKAVFSLMNNGTTNTNLASNGLNISPPHANTGIHVYIFDKSHE